MTAVAPLWRNANVIVLAVLLLAAGLVSPHFWTIENVVNVVRAASLVRHGRVFGRRGTGRWHGRLDLARAPHADDE